jgi:hypothetical protein
VAEQDKTETKRMKKDFRGLDEVALKLNQAPDDAGAAPEHELFVDDDKNIRTEKCATCEDLFAIGFSRIYRTKRTFEALCDQLHLRLEADHRASRNHPALIPLRWFDPTRKRKGK